MKILGLVLACGMLGTSVNAGPITDGELQAKLENLKKVKTANYNRVADNDVYAALVTSKLRKRIYELPENSEIKKMASATMTAIQALEKLRLLYAEQCGGYIDRIFRSKIEDLYSLYNTFDELYNQQQ